MYDLGKNCIICALILMLVMALSACVKPGGMGLGGGSSGMGGVRINTFEVFPSKVPDGDQLDIMLEIENYGVDEASGTAYIYGPAWIGGGTSPLIQENFDLEGADPINNLPGGKAIIEKEITVNAGLPEKMSQTYTLYARICYPYSTTYLATVTMSSKNEFRITRQGIGQSGESITRAPVTIDIMSLPEYANNKLVITFLVKNNGYGYPASVSSCTPTPDFSDVDRITSFKALETTSGKALTCTPDSNIKLSNGQATIRCELDFGMGGVTTPKLQLTIKAEARYTYYVETQTPVTVYKEP